MTNKQSQDREADPNSKEIGRFTSALLEEGRDKTVGLLAGLAIVVIGWLDGIFLKKSASA